MHVTVKCVCVCFSLIFPGVRLSSDAQFSDFLDGLGPAQLVGRQTLATPPMGENMSPFYLVHSPANLVLVGDFFSPMYAIDHYCVTV